MRQSIKSVPPRKPHPDFPLFAHPVGQWVIKVRGKTFYFGVWDNPQAALEKWNAQKGDLLAGRTPRNKSGGLTLRELANRFLSSKQRSLAEGVIKQRTWNGLHTTCERLLSSFGKDMLVSDLAVTLCEQWFMRPSLLSWSRRCDSARSYF